jgi:TonB family protein
LVQKPVATPVLLAGAIGLLLSSCVSMQMLEPLPVVRVDQLDELPTLREMPSADWSDAPGEILTLQSVLDTAGRVTKDLVLDVDDPGRDLSRLQRDVLARSLFTRPRVQGQPRRALVEFRLDLRHRTATVLPQLSDKIAWIESMVDEKPEVLSGPLHYPDAARQAGITGRVIVQAIVGVDGHAERTSIRIIQHVNRDLEEAARYYVNNARFKPARIGGRPVRTLVNLPIDFKIRGRM